MGETCLPILSLQRLFITTNSMFILSTVNNYTISMFILSSEPLYESTAPLYTGLPSRGEETLEEVEGLTEAVAEPTEDTTPPESTQVNTDQSELYENQSWKPSTISVSLDFLNCVQICIFFIMQICTESVYIFSPHYTHI